jgi:hypothetical protein
VFRGRRPALQSSRNSWSPWFLTANSGLQAVTDTLLHPALFFPALVFLTGGTWNQMAIFMVANVVAWSAVPLMLGFLRGLLSSLRPLTWIALLVRLLAAGIIGWVGLNIGDFSTDRMLTLLISAWWLYQIAGALVAQSAAPAALNLLASGGRLQQLQWGRIAAALASLAMGWLALRLFMGTTTLQVDLRGMLVLAALSTVSASWFVALMLFGRTSVSPMVTTQGLGRGMRSALGSSAVRRLVAFRFLLAAVAAVDPFLIVFGFTRLGVDIALIGVAIVAWALGQVVGTVMWPRVTRRVGERTVFQIAALLRLVLLVWVISIPVVVTTSAFTDRFNGTRDSWVAFGGGLVLLGLATSASATATLPYLMRIASTSALPGTSLLANLASAIGGLLPLAVAWGLERYDDQRVLWVGIGLGVVALLASGLLANAGARVKLQRGSWRTVTRTQSVSPANSD